ncbi:tetratricopeptide repeat protein [Amycolatopsis sp. H6(2020)]|nr:tetratricopeptide repeat protein [Amycolatopsis sp. H6(2020)]
MDLRFGSHRGRGRCGREAHQGRGHQCENAFRHLGCSPRRSLDPWWRPASPESARRRSNPRQIAWSEPSGRRLAQPRTRRGVPRILRFRVDRPVPGRYPCVVEGEPQSHVVVVLLGDPEIRVGDRPLAIGHARQRAVLVVLAAEAGRVVPVDSLIERVWGERAPVRARSAVRTYLSNLRRALAPAQVAITRQGSGYLLDVPADAVDLHRFRRLHAAAREEPDVSRALALVEAALGLWRGEPVPEPDTPWARDLRERLRRERAAAEADRVDWALRCGRHHDVLSELATRARTDPWDERVAAQLMLTLYRAGRQAEAMAHYRRVRQRLAGELGADPGPALQRLYQRILTADPALAAPASGAEPATPGVHPRQLPAPPWSFTGREPELTRLGKVFDTSGPGNDVVSISGAGGVGKTWLALHWAYRNLDRFPDGQLYTDLRGFAPAGDPVAPSEVLRGFLEALGVVPASIPVDAQAGAGLYRSVLAGKRALIVLDNARDTEQVLPLLPGAPGCAVLVTSRSRLGALTVSHGAKTLALGVLTDAEARELLAGQLGHDRLADEPAAVTEILVLCAGLPLALGIVAARADSDPALSLTALAADLRDTATRLDALAIEGLATNLRSVFAASYRALPRRAAELFTLLGLAGCPDIGVPAAAALTGRSARETAAILAELTAAHLVEEHAPRRYKMHDLLRLYATESGPAEPAALRRLVDFALHTAYACERLLHPHRAPIDIGTPARGVLPLALDGEEAAIAWLETEYRFLLATQSLAARQGRPAPVWQLAWALDTFHRRRGHVHGQLAVWQAGLTAIQGGTQLLPRKAAHQNLGIACIRTGRHDEALDHLARALDLARQSGDTTGEGHSLLALAYACEQHDDDRQAHDHAGHALAVFRTLGNPVWEAQALTQTGLYLARLGRHTEADEHCQAALELFRRHHERDGEAETLANLAYTAHRTGRNDVAAGYYRHALALRRELGHSYAEATTLEQLSEVHVALGEHEEARAALTRAAELYTAQHRTMEAERSQRRFGEITGT